MATSDVFSVAASYDKTSYNQGQTITVTITGNDVLTTTTQGNAGPLALTITAADGSTTTVTLPTVPVTLTTTAIESVKITAIQDTGATPRPWTIAAGGLTASATA